MYGLPAVAQVVSVKIVPETTVSAKTKFICQKEKTAKNAVVARVFCHRFMAFILQIFGLIVKISLGTITFNNLITFTQLRNCDNNDFELTI